MRIWCGALVVPFSLPTAATYVSCFPESGKGADVDTFSVDREWASGDAEYPHSRLAVDRRNDRERILIAVQSEGDEVFSALSQRLTDPGAAALRSVALPTCERIPRAGGTGVGEVDWVLVTNRLPEPNSPLSRHFAMRQRMPSESVLRIGNALLEALVHLHPRGVEQLRVRDEGTTGPAAHPGRTAGGLAHTAIRPESLVIARGRPTLLGLHYVTLPTAEAIAKDIADAAQLLLELLERAQDIESPPTISVDLATSTSASELLRHWTKLTETHGSVRVRDEHERVIDTLKGWARHVKATLPEDETATELLRVLNQRLVALDEEAIRSATSDRERQKAREHAGTRRIAPFLGRLAQVIDDCTFVTDEDLVESYGDRAHDLLEGVAEVLR